MNTIINNLISLSKEGAFSCKEDIKPMSAFKWNILYKMAEIEDIVPYVCRGLERHREDMRSNIPPMVMDMFSKASFTNADEIKLQFDLSDIDSQKLSYPLKRYLLKDIIYKEKHSIDTSKISLDLLSLILQNTSIILRSGIRLRGIMELGIFLRTKGQLVDFVKVESWLQKLKLKKMAALQASVLTDYFGFELVEFPYVKKTDKRAAALTEKSLNKVYWMNKQERQTSKYNIRNCITFHRYSHSESLCKATSTIIRSLSEIEE